MTTPRFPLAIFGGDPVEGLTGAIEYVAGNWTLQNMFHALVQDGVLHVLAEPNVVAASGQKAEFLSGGEIPVPIASSGTTGGTTITIVWKEFGVKVAFVPTIVDTWHTQFGTWGFGPIHPDWDADQVVEIVLTAPPFSLYDGSGPYTVSTYTDGRRYPERRIWLPSNAEILARYDTLDNGFKVVLAHEFFHLAQWNVRLAAGCSVMSFLTNATSASVISRPR